MHSIEFKRPLPVLTAILVKKAKAVAAPRAATLVALSLTLVAVKTLFSSASLLLRIAVLLSLTFCDSVLEAIAADSPLSKTIS